MNRSILSALNSYSIKSEDFRQLLLYPLCLVPLTNKSKLMEVMLICVVSLAKSVLVSIPKDDLLVDLIALINTMVFELPSMYEEFAQN